MNELKDYSIEDLENEVRKRKEDEKQKLRKVRNEKVNKVLKHRDILAHFMTHARTSCDNTNNSHYHPEHGTADCNLCALMDLCEFDFDIEVFIDIRLQKVQD